MDKSIKIESTSMVGYEMGGSFCGYKVSFRLAKIFLSWVVVMVLHSPLCVPMVSVFVDSTNLGWEVLREGSYLY